MSQGANWQDLTGDFERGYMSVPCLKDHDEVMPVAQSSDEVSRVEMSPATIQALRMMMREEFANGIQEMEERMASNFTALVDDLREEVLGEKEKRQQLETRVCELESSARMQNMAERMSQLEKQVSRFTTTSDADDVDKSVVVLGGFLDKAVAEVEALIKNMMEGVAGYEHVEIIESSPPVALATFQSPMQAMKFIRSQRRNVVIHDNKLWASENRSKTERMQCKATSKLKKFMIELGNIDVKDIQANYKTFKVSMRSNGKMVPVAAFESNASVTWLGQDLVNNDIRDAMENFLADLE